MHDTATILASRNPWEWFKSNCSEFFFHQILCKLYTVFKLIIWLFARVWYSQSIDWRIFRDLPVKMNADHSLKYILFCTYELPRLSGNMMGNGKTGQWRKSTSYQLHPLLCVTECLSISDVSLRSDNLRRMSNWLTESPEIWNGLENYTEHIIFFSNALINAL